MSALLFCIQIALAGAQLVCPNQSNNPDVIFRAKTACTPVQGLSGNAIDPAADLILNTAQNAVFQICPIPGHKPHAQ